MGGIRSTRWNDYERKLTVEECYSLDVNMLVTDGLIKHGYSDSGVIVWTNQITGIELGNCEILTDTTSVDAAWISLSYTTNLNGPKNQSIDLITTTPNYGGIRWWFECPYCGKKIAKMYLAEGPYFKCRTCNDLTYNSCQKSSSKLILFGLLSKEISESFGIPFEILNKGWREKLLKVGRRLQQPDYL